MVQFDSEPTLRVGLAQRRTTAEITLRGPFLLGEATLAAGQRLFVEQRGAEVHVRSNGAELARGPTVKMLPANAQSSFTLHDMTVGVDFHWQHEEDLTFSGSASLESRGSFFDVVNEIPLEAYLQSVISSEMSADNPAALLKAHAVISRSWLLAQLQGASQPGPPPPGASSIPGGVSVIRWYDREDHVDFDVCADDHCQRYQGITRTSTQQAIDAVAGTRGLVLHHGGRVCDARFSKCCGGMTEVFEAAWGDTPVPYLQAFPDYPTASWALPLTDEANAAAFIAGSPPAYCNTVDRALLDKVLPALDHATTAFYRWEETITAAQVRQWVRDKLEIELGPVTALEPMERGPSGRLVRMAIVGELQRLEVGKELEIRRLLSDSHLYSSAFTVRAEDGPEGRMFHLRGAGWGHGVGLCQIGAAVMADQGHNHQAILAHYFRGAALSRVY